jgi:beta-glucosidase
MMKLIKYFSDLVILSGLFMFVFSASCLESQKNYPYQNPQLAIEERVDDLLGRLTMEEKLDLLGGTGFATKPIKRLSIPELRMADGPLGVRWGPSTAFPAGIAMASSWNPEVAEKVGQAIAQEVKGKGRHVILAPCVNIARIPQGGRNFESFGEDPYLCSRMTVGYIQGVQAEKVVATVKHYAANNQEYQRDFVDVMVSERALNEIYLPAFKAAVTEAGVLAVMSAYNKVNGPYCSENPYLLNEKLKDEWGFQGLVMSDWGAVHSTIPTAQNGLDLEMPFGKYLNPSALQEPLKDGTVTAVQIDDKIRRILRVMFTIGLFDGYPVMNSTVINSAEHRQVALEAARAEVVLLKNEEQILPFDLKKITSIAVIGPNAAIARSGGGGSSQVTPIDPVSPLQGLKNRLGDRIQILYAPGIRLDGDENAIEASYFYTDASLQQSGLQAEYYANKNLQGEPKIKKIDPQIDFRWHGDAPSPEMPRDTFSVRWNGFIKAPESGKYVFSSSSDDGTRLYLDDQLLIDDWNDHAVEAHTASITLEKGKIYSLKFEYYENGGDAIVLLGWQLPGVDLETQAVELARKADQVIFFAGTSANFETEGRDRQDLILPNGQDALIQKIVKVNPRLVVVLISGSPLLVEGWIEQVKGVVQCWFGGVEMGNALADVLLGYYNPSGKLPITFPRRWEDCSAYPFYMKESGITRYEDDIFVGYRHFEQAGISPRFAFGYGLSYSKFKVDPLKVSPSQLSGKQTITVSTTIKNISKVDGAEVVQLYIRDVVSSLRRPDKELKGFKKVFLKADESQVVRFSLQQNDLTFYDPGQKKWISEPGEFEILVGSSSREIDLQKVSVQLIGD